MYKIANDKAQAGRDRLKLADLAGAGLPEIQTDEQRRANLVRVVQNLDKRIQACRDLAQRRALGQEKHRTQQEINALRPARSCPGAADHFIEAAREILTPTMFKMVLHRASEMTEAGDPE